jgi:glycosyltransferase involved in cell wall biosynthesis
MRAIEDNPEGITRADIVVGIPSYNEADSILIPTQQADRGLSKFFGDRVGVLINCDNNSPDNTRQAFLDTPTKNPKIYLSTPDGVLGKGQNLKNLFEKALELSARAIVVVDADLKSITPQWIRNLASPLFEDFHLVTPLYARHKYDGLMTKVIVYPLTRALYGRRVRQPVGGEFGISRELAGIFLDNQPWSETVESWGIDVWMTTIAMRSRVPIIQSFMGSPKIHTIKDPEADPGPIFRNTLAIIFELMGKYQDFWKEVKWSRPTAVYGIGTEPEVPPTVDVDVKALWEQFSAGVATYRDLYGEALQPGTNAKLQEVAGLPREGFEFPSALWAKVLYDFACAFNRRTVASDDLVTSLIPLYHGKILSFVLETEAMNAQQVEETIEDACLQFEKTKSYLVDRWFSG